MLQSTAAQIFLNLAPHTWDHSIRVSRQRGNYFNYLEIMPHWDAHTFMRHQQASGIRHQAMQQHPNKSSVVFGTPHSAVVVNHPVLGRSISRAHIVVVSTALRTDHCGKLTHFPENRRKHIARRPSMFDHRNSIIIYRSWPGRYYFRHKHKLFKKKLIKMLRKLFVNSLAVQAGSAARLSCKINSAVAAAASFSSKAASRPPKILITGI